MTDLSAVPFRTRDIAGTHAHAFGGFPYLITLVAPGFHHLTLLPFCPTETLVQCALAQWEANRLPTCLCLDWDTVVYVRNDGMIQPAARLPYAELTLAHAIQPCHFIEELDPSDQRLEQLEQFLEAFGNAEEVPVSGIPVEPLKGGWEGAADERALLLGSNPNGVPGGLFRCLVCGEFRGACLDPSPGLRGITVPVSCRCQNDTRCAACGEEFDGHRLNSNYYDPERNEVIQVSTAPALSHRCGEDEA